MIVMSMENPRPQGMQMQGIKRSIAIFISFWMRSEPKRPD